VKQSVCMLGPKTESANLQGWGRGKGTRKKWDPAEQGREGKEGLGGGRPKNRRGGREENSGSIEGKKRIFLKTNQTRTKRNAMLPQCASDREVAT